MGFSSRRILTTSIIVLMVIVIIEAAAVASVFFIVPDLPARLQRITAVPSAAAPSAQQTPAQLNNDRPLTITDTFDTPSPRWDQSAVRIQDGALHTELFMPNADVYTLWRGIPDDVEMGSRVQDFTMQVNITQARGSDDAFYGIRFRQNTTDSYLMVALNARGYYRVWRSSFGDQRDIVPWTFTRHINQGLNATNQLQVSAANTQVAVFINGVPITTFSDLSPVSGQLTLSTFTTNGDYVDVAFDDVRGESGGKSFSDDFADAATTSFSLGGSFTNNGTYHIISSPNVTVWQNPLPRASTTIANFRLQVDSSIVAGDINQVAYGVIFGDTGDFGYTMLLISGSGVLSVVRNDSDGNSQQYIQPLQLESVGVGLNQQTNIEIVLMNTELRIIINGVDLGVLQLDSNTPGSVGMIVVCGETDVQVDFDNFALQELPSE